MENNIEQQDSQMMKSARHVVSAFFVMAAASVFVPGAGYAEKLLGMSIFVFGAALLITGLAWLFFTRREAGRTHTSFVVATWVLLALVLVGSFR